MNMFKIGKYSFNLDAITWIIDREVFFNNGKSLTLLQPEIDALCSLLFTEPKVQTITVKEEPLVIKKPTVKKASKK